MRRVFKFQLEVKDEQTINVPYLTRNTLFMDQVLLVANQYETPVIWAMVDPAEETRSVRIVIHGTGHDANDTADLAHIGSLIMMSGQFVAHVFSEIMV